MKVTRRDALYLSILVTLPAIGPVSAQRFTTTLGGGTSSKFTFINSTPIITSISPATGTYQGFQWIKILGTGLFGATAVQVGSQQALAFQSITDTQINLVTPAVSLGTGTVDIRVTTPSGTTVISAADHFTYVDQVIPNVTGLSPMSGPVGTTINISGTGFTGATAVIFSGESAVPAVTWSVTSDIAATAVALPPSGMFDTGYYVTVVTPAGSSTAHLGVNNFTVT